MKVTRQSDILYADCRLDCTLSKNNCCPTISTN